MSALHRLMVLLWIMVFAAPGLAQMVDQNRLSTAVEAARQWRQAHEAEIVAEFSQLLALPNFGGDQAAIRQNAQQIVAMFEQRGIAARLLESAPSNPAVYAELPSPGAEHTIMLYVHYDGQPTSDDLWAHPPFQPRMLSGRLEDDATTIDLSQAQPPYDRDWRLYARSASDDKAPLIALLAAIEGLREAGIRPAANLKFFFEGEEEIGSPNLRQMIESHQDLLAADLWLFLDGPVDQSGRQSLTFGVRGVTGVDITTYGPERGLHSGHYGNFSPNPIARLVALLTSMRDAQGRVLIDGFYDEVQPLSADETAVIERLPPRDEHLLDDIGAAAKEMPGERYELALMRPALNFKGIRAGEVGAASRNVIVPSATASIGFRLAQGQSIERLRELVEAHWRQQGYQLINHAPDARQRREHDRWLRVEWETAGYPAVRTPLGLTGARQLINIISALIDDEVVITPSLGGSLPLAHITDTLQVPIALLPIANHDNNQHAPNENIRLGHLWDGIETYAAVLATLDLRPAD